MTDASHVREILDERQRAHIEEHRIHELAHDREHLTTEQAIKTATITLDKRLDGMNEFRDQLRDQAATFIRREQLEAFIDRYEKAHDEVLLQIATEREERRANEGAKKGINQSTAVIVGTIGVAATLLTIVIIVINLVAGTT